MVNGTVFLYGSKRNYDFFRIFFTMNTIAWSHDTIIFIHVLPKYSLDL